MLDIDSQTTFVQSGGGGGFLMACIHLRYFALACCRNFTKCEHSIVCSSIRSQVVLLQTAHSWANAGVLLGGRMHQERGSFRNN